MEKYITWSSLIGRAPASIAALEDCDPVFKKYLSWAPLSTPDEAQLVCLGRLLPDDLKTGETMEVYPGSNYWSPEDPIALGFYPYNFCDVYQMRDCNSFYLVYTEWGGHAPEKRARLVLKKLMIPANT